MAVFDILVEVVLVTIVLHAVATLVVVGPSRLRRARQVAYANAATAAPVAAVLVVVLAGNSVIRDVGVDLSWALGTNVTSTIYALEGEFVADVQSFATPALSAYFGTVYVYGYVFFLTFPVLAYLLADDPRPLRETLVAYAANYGIGLLCYVVFVAYGPRNFMPDMVQSLLYTSWPQSQLLTSEVNKNTNVFPSLHTSLSVTVALLATRFSDVYPRWLPVAVVLAVSISVSTMYLGIHWATDVVFGVVLAGVSLTIADRVVGATDDE